ncbi:sugar phosphate isomerase/epimerase [uncultured Ruegeria sp.]|uniref:sugar phosphate isomerase/epimerase family protein n=1 Tax=uncultured Ruegeria sp. TaxID=259304 RepID=UPI00261A0615|nr:sugar phosphate isomerase/epimerase [uncultured Ruegeria sp.]
MRVSAQLYTVRQCGDLAQQLKMVADAGFTDVETTGLHRLSPAQMADIVQKSGLRVRSAHFDWEELEDRFDDIIEVMNLLNCEVAVMPWLAPEARPSTVEGWSAVSGQLSEWADQLAVHDVKLAYHNHDFDLVGCPGHSPLDLILAQGNIYLQPDIGWLVAAGFDPVSFIQCYSDLILSVHAKDVDPTRVGDERWRDLGDGVVEWAEVLAALDETNCSDLFVEHDETPDHRRTLETGKWFLESQLVRAA